ncbi:putative BTB/POZ domain-containing protein KCTD3 [Paratrimastix pyriformis]|uniref:BTB/POZ domain-containing protein KCTD3 n=1 Tax=Paratrimastix pyriformis TaxID=342808 RepID=A0ABQ8UXG3_9EUKA|nr:putative BTB/POZ domain-containing protein KCTD3 [Paratrimastix pyriformis]
MNSPGSPGSPGSSAASPLPHPQESIELFTGVLQKISDDLTASIQQIAEKLQAQALDLQREKLAMAEDRRMALDTINHHPDISALEAERSAFEESKKKAYATHKIETDVIELNVGGTKITTMRDTLLKCPESFLSYLFSGYFPVRRDRHGRFFLDRDPTQFSRILDLLRTGDLPPLRNEAEELLFLREAEYWGIPLPGAAAAPRR